MWHRLASARTHELPTSDGMPGAQLGRWMLDMGEHNYDAAVAWPTVHR